MRLTDIIFLFKEHISSGKDLHILRHYSSFIVISKGKVIYLTDPSMTFCPLGNFLYPDLKNISAQDSEKQKTIIKETIEKKIKESGQFSDRREIYALDITVPYGASEMMIYALQKNVVDAAVVVCDGAGTVITNNPHIVQGIGGRMNGLFWTSPIRRVQEQLKTRGCSVVSNDAKIDQMAGIQKAIQLGRKRIAVTINGFRGESLGEIRDIEKRSGISIYIFVVCTTGIEQPRINEIKSYADVVWSCGSIDVRQEIGAQAILQFSKAIPVFVLTEKGVKVVGAYFENPNVLSDASKDRPFLICDDCSGEKIKVGNFVTRICSTKLPAYGKRQPLFKKEMGACK